MHKLARISISNFRSCKNVELPLGDLTPIVGYNNAGKSNILTAIEWLIEPFALGPGDFFDASSELIIEGIVTGIDMKLMEKMPVNQHGQVKKYIYNENLRFRRTLAKPGAFANIKLEVRDPAIKDDMGEKAWVINPAGIPQAMKALFPDSIRIQAMQDAADDVAKQTKGNTIGKLVADVIEPVRKAHEGELRAALKDITEKFSADGENRSEQLKAFDEGATASLSELFPGLRLKLDVPIPEITDLFKNGAVRVVEAQGDAAGSKTFGTLGHGAQRCIQMALVRYLSEKSAGADDSKRKLLLIDEPELFLHPQGIEQVRQALKTLSAGRYQVIFSTHSPVMLHRDHATNAVIVRKPNHEIGTLAYKPLSEAVQESINNAGHAARVIFELGNAAQVFFSDRVLLNEGKTEQALLPLFYESYFSRTPRADRIGLVPMQGSGNFHNAFTVLKAMEIDGKIVADLDYAFGNAKNIFDDSDAPDLTTIKKILTCLQSIHGFPLDGGMPTKDKKGNWTAAKVWRLFATDKDGAEIVSDQHEKLKKHGVWIWKEGTIEDVIGISEKGEAAVQKLEQEIPTHTPMDLEKKYPSIVLFLKWLVN
jgi:putative ATP-dependent endonuclease of OLD family